MICKRGDIVLAWFTHSDLATMKRRPALVVQADNLNAGIAQVVLAHYNEPIKVGASQPGICPAFMTGVASGLVADSVIMTDNIATVIEKAIDSVIGGCLT